MFRKKKKNLSDELLLFFSSKVQNLPVFSIIYMIRIRFFGPGELIQKGFRAAEYTGYFAYTNLAGTRCWHVDLYGMRFMVQLWGPRHTPELPLTPVSLLDSPR